MSPTSFAIRFDSCFILDGHKSILVVKESHLHFAVVICLAFGLVFKIVFFEKIVDIVAGGANVHLLIAILLHQDLLLLDHKFKLALTLLVRSVSILHDLSFNLDCLLGNLRVLIVGEMGNDRS